jgi:flagellar hook assembly protein FlgD
MTLMRTISTFGAAGLPPDGVPLTAADFASLPTTAEDGSIYTITAETGITGLAVRYSTSATAWLVTSATCSYAIHSAAEWASTAGTWYDAGGIVVRTADGATVYDTTYSTSWRWASASGVFVPPSVYAGSISALQTVRGDSAAPAGWTVVTTNAGGAASVTTDGTKVLLAVSTAGSGTSVAGIEIDDPGATSATRFYSRLLIQITSITQGTGGSGAAVYVTREDGTDAYDFGTSRNRTGRFFNAATGGDYSAQSANAQDLVTAEILLEVRKFGTRCEARAGGSSSPWQSLSGSTARNVATTRFYVQVVASRTGGTSAIDVTVRQLRTMRY